MVMSLVGVSGRIHWEGSIDHEGYRTYLVSFEAVSDFPKGASYLADGPAAALTTPGLPLPGAPYQIDTEYDAWAWCLPQREARPLEGHKEGDPYRYWRIDCYFSNRPTERQNQRCHDIQIEDPLLEPPKVSGTFTKFLTEAGKDRWGDAITNSAHEQIRGPQVEFDDGRDTVRIEMNVPFLDLYLLSSVKNTVNSLPIWGFGPRCVKLSHYTWEPKMWGQCSRYYTVVLEFETDPNTFDRTLIDEGTKVLNGHWDSTREWILDQINGEDPDPGNPNHFIGFRDFNQKEARVILDGKGKPWRPSGFYVSTPAVAVDEGPDAWLPTLVPPVAVDRVTGEVDGEVATFNIGAAGGGFSQRGALRLSSYTVPALAADQFEIGKVLLHIYAYVDTQVVGIPGGVIFEYRLGGAGAWIELERFDGMVTAADLRGYDVTPVIAASWINVAALQIRVRADLPENSPARVTLDGAELVITGTRRPGSIFVSKYRESDLYQLGIPAVF